MDFINLPDDILLIIFDLLPPVYINLIFLNVSEVRQLVIHTYMSKVQFVLNEPEFNNLRNDDTTKMARFSTLNEIETFLKANPRFLPEKIEVIAGNDMAGFVRLIRNHFELFSNKNVDLHINLEELPSYEAILLLSKLQKNISEMAVQILKNDFHFNNRQYLNRDHISKVLAYGGRQRHWDYFLKPRVKDLYSLYDFTILYLPSVVSKLSSIRSSKTINTYSTNLKRLSIKNMRAFSTLHIHDFPKTLEYIEVLGNNIFYIQTSWYGNTWPPKLKTLILNENSLRSPMLYDISTCGWPPEMESLTIANNYIQSLVYLKNLPNSLKHLDITAHKSFKLRLQILLKKEHAESGGYPYIDFPSQLALLRLDRIILDEESRINNVDIKFPKRLLELSMNECQISTLDFKFPSTLRSLSLSGNSISDITTYYSWEKLTSLTYLDLSLNQIKSLDEWLPPANLVKLNLDCNDLELPENTPIFLSSKNSELKLRYLSLKESYISDYSKIELPPLLKSLNLEGNRATTLNLKVPVQFTQILKELNLSHCNIQNIEFDKITIKSTIRKLDLSRCCINSNENIVDTFYNDIQEKLQLKVIITQDNINSLHKFY